MEYSKKFIIRNCIQYRFLQHRRNPINQKYFKSSGLLKRNHNDYLQYIYRAIYKPVNRVITRILLSLKLASHFKFSKNFFLTTR